MRSKSNFLIKNHGRFLPLLAMSLAAAQMAHAIELNDLPAVVRNAVLKQAGEAKINAISKDDEQGHVSYSVIAIANNGKSMDFSIDPEGQLVLETINIESVPAPVKKTMDQQAGSDKIIKVERSFDLGSEEYHISTANNAGKEGGFTVEADGTLASVLVELNETPAPVQKTISARLAGRKIESIEKTIEGNSFEFDVEVIDAKGRWEKFTVSATGNLESVTANLEELAPAVQKTIREQLGDGKIREILKIMPPGPKGNPCEVYGVKNAKPFDFKVGPAGKFLGMLD